MKKLPTGEEEYTFSEWFAKRRTKMYCIRLALYFGKGPERSPVMSNFVGPDYIGFWLVQWLTKTPELQPNAPAYLAWVREVVKFLWGDGNTLAKAEYKTPDGYVTVVMTVRPVDKRSGWARDEACVLSNALRMKPVVRRGDD